MAADHPFRKAQWLWPGLPFDLRNTYADFRRDFRLAKIPRRAPFFITADQNYMLYVNGRYVGRGPARGFQERWPYDEYDLAPLLRRGRNWISLRAYNSGASNGQYVFRSAAGLICAGAFGGVDLATGGAGWLERINPAARADAARLSWLLNFQEHMDARLDDQSWITSAVPPKGWKRDVWAFPRAPGCEPWPAFEARGIPHLGSKIVPYAKVVSVAEGKNGSGWETWHNLSLCLREEQAGSKWRPAPGNPPPGDFVRMPAVASGRWRAVLLDLGKPSIGTLMAKVAGARGGEALDFYFCEAVNDDGSPFIPNGRICCGASLAARLRLRPGRNRHEFFQLMGHRYLAVIVRGSAAPLSLKLALRFCVYPMQVTGRFETDHAGLNGIHRICVNTQRVCALDSYVDTPWREQAQWWGDARVQAQNTFHLCGDTRLMARGIRQIAAQELANGLTYGHAPTCLHNCVLPDFSLIWLLTIWDYYHQTGDADLFTEQWPRVRRLLLNYFKTEGRDPRTGLLRYDPRYWLFLDWTEIHKDPIPTLLNLWYVLTLQKLAIVAGAARMKPERREMESLLSDQTRRVNRHLWDAGAGLFHDGLDRKGRPVPTHCVHNQTLALHTGLQPAHHAAMLSRSLLPYARDEKIDGVARPSSYWVTYVYEALSRAGHGREAIGHILRHYSKMVPDGGTWESFEIQINDTVGSRSHAWSAHPMYHFARIVGGVFQTDTAWRRIRFAPDFTIPGVNRAKVAVPTPHGLIEASWTRTAGRLDVEFRLPRGITADVILPGIPCGPVTGRHRWRGEGGAGVPACATLFPGFQLVRCAGAREHEK